LDAEDQDDREVQTIDGVPNQEGRKYHGGEGLSTDEKIVWNNQNPGIEMENKKEKKELGGSRTPTP